jgi:methylenetetrahydrofolate dehydrogenase (NADP+) / methenyltetrahydrofolate cyclohydrolase
MIIFDGYAFAKEKEAALARRLAELAPQTLISEEQPLTIAAVLFTEDKGSQLYTSLKQQAAERLGMKYQVHTFSITDPIDRVLERINLLNQDSTITGIIIQKPWKKTWELAMEVSPDDEPEERTVLNNFSSWWRTVVRAIDEHKDVDGLHPSTLEAIHNNTWKAEGKVLPATVRAVLSILDVAGYLRPQKYIVLGKSDILGMPLAYELQNRGFELELLGRKELRQRQESGDALKDADVVITATGMQHLVQGEMLKKDVVLVDVGEPKPDVQRESVKDVAKFLTPVPGGVGPLTVISLLENAVELYEQHRAAKWLAARGVM